MRKVALLLFTMLIFTASGCNIGRDDNNVGTAQGNNPTPSPIATLTPTITKTPLVTPSPTPKATTYKNGTYTALGDKWAYGQESADLKIKNNKIIYITLRRLDTAGKEVNYKEWVGKKDASGKLRPNLNKFRIDMAKRMLARQSYVVDSISGATVSCANWKIAVQRALAKAQQ